MITNRFGSLSRRERSLLLAGIVLVLAVAGYVLVLEPRYQRLYQLRAQVPALQADLSWMKAQVRGHQDLFQQRGAEAGERPPLLTVLERSVTEAGLRDRMTRMQPAEQGQVRVWFDDVAFDAWLRWLGTLGGFGITVTAVNVDRGDPGRVDVRLTVRP